MSHDSKHEMIERRLEALAEAQGLKWESCPSDEYGEENCTDRCGSCQGAGKVLVSVYDEEPGDPIDPAPKTPPPPPPPRCDWTGTHRCVRNPSTERTDAGGTKLDLCSEHAELFDKNTLRRKDGFI